MCRKHWKDCTVSFTGIYILPHTLHASQGNPTPQNKEYLFYFTEKTLLGENNIFLSSYSTGHTPPLPDPLSIHSLLLYSLVPGRSSLPACSSCPAWPSGRAPGNAPCHPHPANSSKLSLLREGRASRMEHGGDCRWRLGHYRNERQWRSQQ